MTRIKRFPDGTFILRVDTEELEIVKLKIENNEELDDRELSIAREFGL